MEPTAVPTPPLPDPNTPPPGGRRSRGGVLSRVLAVAVCAASAALALGGLGVFGLFAAPAVPGADVAGEITRQLDEVGVQTFGVDCPDLPAEVGAQITCDAVVEGLPAGIPVEAVSVDGDLVTYLPDLYSALSAAEHAA